MIFHLDTMTIASDARISLTIQCTHRGNYAGCYWLRASYGAVQLGIWGIDTRGLHDRRFDVLPDLALTMVGHWPGLEDRVIRAMQACDDHEDTRPVESWDLCQHVAAAIGRQTGQIPVISIAHVVGGSNPFQQIAGLLALSDTRNEITRLCGARTLRYIRVGHNVPGLIQIIR